MPRKQTKVTSKKAKDVAPREEVAEKDYEVSRRTRVMNAMPLVLADATNNEKALQNKNRSKEQVFVWRRQTT